MITLRDAAQQALEALIAATPVKAKDPQMQADAIVALRAALAEPVEQDPVEIEMPEYHSHGMGCGLEDGLEDRGITDRYEAMEYGWYEAIDRVKEELANFGPLYTAPQPVKREPLTDESWIQA